VRLFGAIAHIFGAIAHIAHIFLSFQWFHAMCAPVQMAIYLRQTEVEARILACIQDVCVFMIERDCTENRVSTGKDDTPAPFELNSLFAWTAVRTSSIVHS
jgi:hypothetical protein